VPRLISPWEYLLGGLLFTLVGIMVFVGPALFGSGSGTTFGIPIWFVIGPFGALLLGIGGYWLWRFDRLRTVRESRSETTPP
jgi:hypothetical protein